MDTDKHGWRSGGKAQRTKLKAQGKGQAPSRLQTQDTKRPRRIVSRRWSCGRHLVVSTQLKRAIKPQRHDEHRERQGIASTQVSRQSVSPCLFSNSLSSLCSSCLCGSSESTQLNSYDFASKSPRQSHIGLLGSWNLVLPLSFELYPLSFPIRVPPCPSAVHYNLPH